MNRVGEELRRLGKIDSGLVFLNYYCPDNETQVRCIMIQIDCEDSFHKSKEEKAHNGKMIIKFAVRRS